MTLYPSDDSPKKTRRHIATQASSPPLRPMCQVVYPPRMPAYNGTGGSSQGLPLCATSHSNSRSVLPGRGRGMTEESTTATEKKAQRSQVRKPVRRQGVIHARRNKPGRLSNKDAHTDLPCIECYGFEINRNSRNLSCVHPVQSNQ